MSSSNQSNNLSKRSLNEDLESQRSEDDDKQEKRSHVFVVTCDGHPTPELRNIHNSNVIILLFATLLDILMFGYYINSIAFVLWGIFGQLVPLTFNYIWLLISYENKLKSIREYNYVIGLYIVMGMLGAFQLGLAVFLFCAIFTGGLSSGTSASY